MYSVLKCVPSIKAKYVQKYYLEDTKLLVKIAPEPSDILWTGISSTKNKSLMRIKSTVTVYLTILAFLLLIVILKIQIKSASKKYDAIW